MNLVTFGLCLLNYFFLLGKEPGYQKNTTLLKECGGESDNKPLKKLLEDECDLKNYCPTCFVLKGIDKKHCFICNKCVLEMSHHCFWLNKCIGKKNKIIYIIFAISAFIYSFCCLFICLNLLFDTVNNSYKLSVLSFDLYIDRGFRVLGAAIVTLFSGIISFLCRLPEWQGNVGYRILLVDTPTEDYFWNKMEGETHQQHFLYIIGIVDGSFRMVNLSVWRDSQTI